MKCCVCSKKVADEYYPIFIKSAKDEELVVCERCILVTAGLILNRQKIKLKKEVKLIKEMPLESRIVDAK